MTTAPERSAPIVETDRKVKVSVLILVTYNPEPLADLYQDLAGVMREVSDDFEFLFLVEPAFAGQVEALRDLAARGEPIRVLQVGQAMGETSLLRLGTAESRGSIIVTSPGYRQVESAAIGGLVRMVEEGSDMATARRWPRHDSLLNRAHTRVFHALAAAAGNARTEINDVSCGVRAMRRELVEEIPLYGDLGLFLPVLAVRDGFTVKELAARQHPADQRTRLHSPVVYVRRLFDLLGLFFLLRFTEKPMRFFGAIGATVVLPGAVILAVLLLQRVGGQGIADRPLLLFGVLLVVLGIQAIALGLIGEIIVHLHASRQRSYRVRSQGSDE